MAIQDNIEVTLTLSSVNRDLKETLLPPGYQSANHNLPWASSPRTIENSVIAPTRRTFSISITLHPQYNKSLGDGLHVTVIFDDGQLVHHYYSIKYAEMDRYPDGALTKSIPLAIVNRPQGGQESIMFQFSEVPALENRIPLSYSAAGNLPSEGTISVTIIPTRHTAQQPAYMSMPAPQYGLPSNEANSCQIVGAPFQVVDQTPVVQEGCAEIDLNSSLAWRYIFRYTVQSIPIMDCVR